MKVATGEDVAAVDKNQRIVRHPVGLGDQGFRAGVVYLKRQLFFAVERVGGHHHGADF